MKIGLIITAGGSGTRLNAPEGKPFVDINGKPLIVHTLEKFSTFDEGVVTVDPDKKEHLKKILNHHNFSNFQIVEGGPTRKASVENGFNALKNVDIVMIHDAARPNVSPELINSLILHSKEKSAVIPAIPVTDTLKVVKNQTVTNTLDRSHCVHVQTPQVFHYDILKKSYERNHVEVTDEASLVESTGEKVTVIPGEQTNIKITYPIDLKMAALLLTPKT